MTTKKYEYRVVDRNDVEHSLIAGFLVVEDAHLCFYTDAHGDMLHAFFQPVSNLCLGEYKDDFDYMKEIRSLAIKSKIPKFVLVDLIGGIHD